MRYGIVRSDNLEIGRILHLETPKSETSNWTIRGATSCAVVDRAYNGDRPI